jgi:hypothetical protein
MTKALVWVNPLLFIAFCLQAGSGLGLALADSEIFIRIHIYNAYFLSAMIVVHLALNWGWVKAFLLSKRP